MNHLYLGLRTLISLQNEFFSCCLINSNLYSNRFEEQISTICNMYVTQYKQLKKI